MKKGDKVPSESTVRRLFNAPNKRTRSAKYYREVIAAKPATKRNQATVIGKESPHRHGCFSLMRMVKEWAEMNSEEVFVFSVDDKAKVSLQYFQISKKFQCFQKSDW